MLIRNYIVLRDHKAQDRQTKYVLETRGNWASLLPPKKGPHLVVLTTHRAVKVTGQPVDPLTKLKQATEDDK